MTTDLLPDLVRPGDPGWDAARRSWNTSVDQHPAAVAQAGSVADVQAAVRHARSAGLRVAPQTTGHGSEALDLEALRGALLLRTAGLDAVSVDPAARTATIGAGALAGAVGLSLGGGLGWLSRAHGLASNGVTAIEVVTAGGDALRVDAGHEPDLFWALRGGGGRAAIVTAMEVALHPIEEATAGMAAWPVEHAGDVVEQVRRWAREAPERAGVVVRILSLPPVDALPAPIRGRRIVAVLAAHVGPAADAERLLAPLRGSPGGALLDTFGPVGAADLVRVAGDPEDPAPVRGGGLLLDELTPAVGEAFAELAADAQVVGSLSVLELRQLGGAVGRPAPAGHGALASIDAGWAVFGGGAAGDADQRAAVDAALAVVRARLAPFTAARVLLSASGGGTNPASGFDPATWGRLVSVRDAYDPDRLILANHDA